MTLKAMKPKFTQPALASVAASYGRMSYQQRMDAERARAEAAGIHAEGWDMVPKDMNLDVNDGATIINLDGVIHMGAYGRLRDILNKAPDHASMRMDIHSPGGDAVEAVAMLNLLLDDGRVHQTRIVGEAFSAASYLFLAAKQRHMELGTSFGIHEAWSIAIGNADEMRGVADRLDATSQNIASVYSRQCGGSAEQWRELMKNTTWMNAQEAKACGAATTIADETGDGKSAPAAADEQKAQSNNAKVRTANHFLPVNQV